MMFGKLMLFVLILLVLVLATTVKSMGLTEGFLSFQKSVDEFTDVRVNAYNNKRNITKFYDETYYDPKNGNVIGVFGTQYGGTGSDDTTGGTVSKIDIVPRDNKSNIITYSKGTTDQALSQESDESKKTKIDSIDTHWTKKFTNNQVTCVTWGTATFMYVMDVTSSKTSGNTVVGNTSVTYSGTYQPAVAAYYTGEVKSLTNKYIVADNNLNESRKVLLTSTYTYVNDGKDGNNVFDDYYASNRGLYQLVNNVKYDPTNGNLLIQTGTGTSKSLKVYYRNASHINDTEPDVTYSTSTSTTTAAADRPFAQISNTPYFIKADVHTIMYWPNNDNTILVVFANSLDSDNAVRLVTCKRFTKNGLYTSNGITKDSGSGVAIDTSNNSDVMNAFSRWYMYFNSNTLGNSNDYLLKTQIVPPVCPACPSCQGVCTNCGGSGGSGTKTSDMNSLAFASTGNVVSDTVGTAGNIVNSAVGTAGNIVNSTVDTAGNVVGKTLDTAGNIVGKTFDTAGNIVGKTFDAAGNLLGSTADRLGLERTGYKQSYNGPENTSSSDGATGYQSGAQSGASSYQTGSQSGAQSDYRPGSNTTGVSSLPNAKPTDMYSYNGKLQPKGSNYIAMTSDFSRFGR
jgi:hypothetical protein